MEQAQDNEGRRSRGGTVGKGGGDRGGDRKEKGSVETQARVGF